jgi:hypothetical protein
MLLATTVTHFYLLNNYRRQQSEFISSPKGITSLALPSRTFILPTSAMAHETSRDEFLNII